MLTSDIQLEIYIALVAVIFTAAGAFFATRFSNRKVDLQKVEDLALTNREQEVLQLISKGMSNAEIADRLFLSLSTVKREVSGLFLKMNVKNRTEAQRKYSDFSRKP